MQSSDVNKLFEKLNQVTPSKGSNNFFVKLFSPTNLILVGLILILVVVGIFTCYFQVEPDEVVVKCRFGEYVDTYSPGIHFRLPFGIETVDHVPGSNFIIPVEFGYRTTKAGVESEFDKDNYKHESLMLTGDLNIADVTWAIQYRVTNAKDYLFNVYSKNPAKEGPINTFRDAAEAVMRGIVGDHSVDEVIIVSRRLIASMAQSEMQLLCDKYQMGITIETVELQDVNPPESVKPSFNEVNAAQQEMQKTVNQAYEDYNKVIPRATGEAEKVIKEAEGYATARINRAQGDANQFLSIYEEYRLAKDVTRRRMYLETLMELLPNLEVKILDKDLKGVLPMLNLNQTGGGN